MLDFPGDLAMELGREAGDAAGQDFARFGHESLEDFGVLVIDGFQGDVDTTAGHRAVGTAEVGTALRSLRLHKRYLVSRWSVWRFKKGLYFFFSKRVGVLGLFLFRVEV